jgi:hypothetical protein
MPTDRFSVRVTLVAVLVGAGVAACGAGTRATDERFLARADAICTEAVARHDGATFPVAGFDPEHPRAQDLPAVGDYLATYGAASETTARLEALPAPTVNPQDWISLRAALDQVVGNAQQQVAAARRSDVTEFERTVRSARALASKVDTAATKVGFTAHSPCRKVFG